MTIVNLDQAAHWNSNEQVARWVARQEQHDRMLAPFTGLLLDAAALSGGDQVLDVGCGCGTTTLTAARMVARGAATGVDLSVPMLARARERAAAAGVANVSFEHGDAQVYRFEPAFNAVISRFGVMFFSDPAAAFANMRGATHPGGRLAFVCWQPLAANEWLSVPFAALAEHVPMPEQAEHTAPGIFALAEADRVRDLLAQAGWEQVAVTPRAVQVPVGGGVLDDAVSFVRTGPLGRSMLDGADHATRERAVQSMRDALARRAGPDGVWLGASVWLVQATA